MKMAFRPAGMLALLYVASLLGSADAAPGPLPADHVAAHEPCHASATESLTGGGRSDRG